MEKFVMTLKPVRMYIHEKAESLHIMYTSYTVGSLNKKRSCLNS